MKKAYIFAGVSIFFWSTMAVSAKLLLSDFNNIQVLCFSSFFAAVSLFIFNLVTGRLKICKTYGVKDYLIISLVGIPGIFLYHIFYYGGAALLPASQAFIINYLWPIMSIVFACIILKEKMTIRKCIALLLSFLGVALVVGGELLTLNPNIVSGGLLCVLAAISYGLFVAVNKKYNYDNCIAMMIYFTVSFLLTALMVIVQKEVMLPQGTQILGFLWSGIFTMAIPNTTWVFALAKGNTAKISNLAYLTPFASLLWSGLILHEPLKLMNFVGLSIIILGILIQLKDTKKSENKRK